MKRLNRKGFTLVELMIATAVFSVIMMISLYAFIQINRLYTKGINIAKTQDAVRNITTDLGSQIQLTTGTPNINTNAAGGTICIGKKLYTFNINNSETGSGNALVSEQITEGDCMGIVAKEDRRVLLPKGTRLLVFNVVESPHPLYKITVSLLNGGDDLVQKGTDPTDYSLWRCNGNIKGSEYCALSKIETVVYKRI